MHHELERTATRHEAPPSESEPQNSAPQEAGFDDPDSQSAASNTANAGPDVGGAAEAGAATDKTPRRVRRDGTIQSSGRPDAQPDEARQVRARNVAGESDSGDGAGKETDEWDDDDPGDPCDPDEFEDPGALLPPVVYARTLRQLLRAKGQSLETEFEPPEPGKRHDPLLFDLLCDITEEQTAWLWPGRVALEQVTLFVGGDDRGASLVAHDLAARVSRGDIAPAAWPDAAVGETSGTQSGTPPHEPASNSSAESPRAGRTSAALHDPLTPSVIYFTKKNERATLCAPGLRQAGAHDRQLICLSGVINSHCQGTGWTHPFHLPGDYGSLRAAIKHLGRAQLLVLDPFEEFLDREAGPRGLVQAMQQLQELAYEFGFAVVAVTRLKKNTSRRRVLPEVEQPQIGTHASAAWGVVRAGKFKNRFLMLPIKPPLDGQDTPLGIRVGIGPQLKRLVWDTSPGGAKQLESPDSPSPDEYLKAAGDWLVSKLAEANGALPRTVIEKLAQEHGFTKYILRRACIDRKIEIDRVQVFKSHSIWLLPAVSASGEGGTEDVQNRQSSGAGVN